MSPRLAYLVSHPIQYQVPLFRRLAQSRRLDFVALFGCDFGVAPSFDPQFGHVVDFGIDLLSGYEHRFIHQARRRPDVNAFLGLVAQPGGLLETRPDAVILHGWRTAMMWQAAATARARGIPYMMRAETPSFKTAPRARRWSRDLAVNTLLRGADALLALGEANERFYVGQGCDRARIHRVPYFVDNGAVAAEARAGRSDRASIRAALDIPEHAVVIVAVGKLMPRKRPLDLVRALRELPENVHVLWIGSGELEAEVRRVASVEGVEGRFHLAGFRQAAETWRLLGASDVFALGAQNEMWGLVVNEAVAADLPTIVSDQCGAAEDLVVAGSTGEVVPVANQPALVAALRTWTDRAARGDRGDSALRTKLAANHSIERAAEAIEDVVDTVVAPARRRAG